MPPTNLLWQERRSDSVYVESVWRCQALEATTRAVIADPCICISLVTSACSIEVVIAGPKSRPRLLVLPAGYTCITIRLKPGVGLKGYQASDFINDAISTPADCQGVFIYEGISFRFPAFEHAEQLVAELFAAGCLSFTQLHHIPTQPRRTYSRQIKRFTGISPYKLYQLERIHLALRLLKQGATTGDVIARLNFTDQAHLVHASKQLLGFTPKQLKRQLLQTP